MTLRGSRAGLRKGADDVVDFFFFNVSEPHAGFRIAFNMFDADGNEMVDKREFMVVCAPLPSPVS